MLTAAFNVDSGVGTFSESIPRRATRLLTLISADSGWFCNLLVLDPLLGVPFRTVFPFFLRSLVFCFSRRRWLNLVSAERKPCSQLAYLVCLVFANLPLHLFSIYFKSKSNSIFNSKTNSKSNSKSNSIFNSNSNSIPNSRDYFSRRLIVAPRKFDVLKTNICPRSEASSANMLVLRTSNFRGATIFFRAPAQKSC